MEQNKTSAQSSQPAKFNHPKIGACWNKQGRSGNKFLSGDIEVTDSTGQRIKIDIMIFPNQYKDTDNKPDLVIYQTGQSIAKKFVSKKDVPLKTGPAADKAGEMSVSIPVADDLPL